MAKISSSLGNLLPLHFLHLHRQVLEVAKNFLENPIIVIFIVPQPHKTLGLRQF